MNWYELLFYKYIKGAQGQPKLRIMMPVFKGGTEQVLPENGSTPTTAPIIADMRYPDALRTDQTFLYRESPTQESGNARLRRIKGNTLGWNQLVQNGNFESTSNWSRTRVLTSASSNVLTVTVTEASTGKGQRVYQNLGFNDTHKRLYRVEMKGTSGKNLCFGNHTSDAAGYTTISSVTADGSWQTLSGFSNENKPYLLIGMNGNTSVGDSYQIRNVVCFDLTQMFGSGNEPSTVEEFTSLFPLPYYDFNQGTLIPFSGNGIKTTGKNLLESANLQIGKNWAYGSASNRAIWEFDCEPNTKYHIDLDYSTTITNVVVVYKVGHVGSQISNTPYQTQKNIDITTPNGCDVVCIQYEGSANISASDIYTINRAYLYGDENITSLPISTYFPTGMKRAGNVYDELTESKAITRVGAVDLGTLTWVLVNSEYWQCRTGVSGMKLPTNNVDPSNAKHSNYATVGGYYVQSANQIGIVTNGYINCNNGSTTDKPSGYLYYELATETETPITTEDANEALSLLMGKSVSSPNANQLINIITKGE